MIEKMFANHFGTYPCNVYLNNAIRFLLKVEPSNDDVNSAISEICYAIYKANGSFAKDVKEELINRNLCEWLN